MNPELPSLRARGYTLLGRLLLEGTRPELLEALDGAVEHDADLDLLAAEHHRLLEVEVHPYATVFLEPGSLTGGRAAELAREICAELDLPRATLDLSDDHLGALLIVLGRLCDGEVRAAELDDHKLRARVLVAQRRLLDEALLSWLVALRAALRDQRGLWPEVIALAHDLARDHRGHLDGDFVAPELPAPPALLDDDDTRLRDLARFALTPCWSGAFFLRGVLTRIARGQDLPTGFGSRAQVLEGLLRSASEYGDPPAVLRALASAFVEEAGALRDRADDVDAPAARVFAARAEGAARLFTEAARRAEDARAA